MFENSRVKGNIVKNRFGGFTRSPERGEGRGAAAPRHTHVLGGPPGPVPAARTAPHRTMSKKHLTDEELSKEWPYLTRQQVKDFKDAFAIFDKDGGGSITTEELGDVMKSLGQKPSQHELVAMVQEIDADGNGEIDFPEFLTMMLRKMNEGNPEKELMDVFTVFDQDGSGTISAEELRAAMKVIGEKLTEEEIEQAIKLADASGDGEVDYDEFIQFVLSE